jgi:hypothetical protein
MELFLSFQIVRTERMDSATGLADRTWPQLVRQLDRPSQRRRGPPTAGPVVR